MTDAASPTPAALLRHVIDSLSDGVVVADAEGRTVLCNPAARRLLGRDPTDVPAGEWPSAFDCLLPDMVTPYPPEQLPLTRLSR